MTDTTYEFTLTQAERLRISYRWATVEMAVQSLAQSQALFAQDEIERTPEWMQAAFSAMQAGIDFQDKDAVLVHGFAVGILKSVQDRGNVTPFAMAEGDEAEGPGA